MLRLIFSLLLLPAAASAGPVAWVTGKALSGTQAGQPESDAPRYACVTLLRHNIPGEAAVQVAGPDPMYPGMLYSGPHGVSYFLTDAGSQWPSALALSQKILAVLETYEGQHGWRGSAHAGAQLASVGKNSVLASLLTLPDAFLHPIPAPQLLTASASPASISLSLGHVDDPSGQVLALALWRRAPGAAAWDYLASLPNPVSGAAASYQDQQLSSGDVYEYALGIDISWPGGSGAGARPLENGLYSTQARTRSQALAAASQQPSPTPLPAQPLPSSTPLSLAQGWLAYPNPVHGNTLWLSFDAPAACSYRLRAFTLNGEKALEINGNTENKGRVTQEIAIKSLASGIYLMKLSLKEAEGRTIELPIQKLGVIK